MAWDQLDVNKPHLVYIILGGFTSLFMLCSSVIKERLYIGEATVATICGIIFGPHAANLINPLSWGNTDQITLEFSRIVLVVQCFAVGVELPKAYMERHWRSVTFLLVPVMTFGWLVTSLFIWAMFHPTLNWLDSLCVAACVTATDPVLASSVVGKGKFAKRVPKHLRDLLSAESGCNDGMAFPFIYLALYLLKYRPDANEVALHWICITILYECIFGAVYGVTVGYIARRAIRYAHEKDWVDRESFLVFYFVLALFCAGSGSILGIDDLLVGFACGVGFSNDGWFTEKTEESHVSNVIDLLINLAFFVYFGTIIPWAQFNIHMYNLDVWRLVVIGLLVLFFRRIPIMMALKPVIPDIKTWREALFAGHFGPIGVGAIFVAILARGELETHYETTTPLADLPPDPDFPHLNIIRTIWPITTFLVICSIVVHGSSIAVFTLGKHINTLTLTMSYTQANEQGPSWMDRLPRIQSRSKSSMSIGRDSDIDEKEHGGFPPGTLGPVGAPGTFLRRQREEDNPSRNQSRASSRHRSRRSKRFDSGEGPGGPISLSAIAPVSRQESEEPWTRSDSDTLAAKSESPPDREKQNLKEQKPDVGPEPEAGETTAPESGEIFEEGDETVYEDEEGNVLGVERSELDHSPEGRRNREYFEKQEGKRLMHQGNADENHGVATPEDDPKHDPADVAKQNVEKAEHAVQNTAERPGRRFREGLDRMGSMAKLHRGGAEKTAKPKAEEKKKPGPARAYQYGNTIIVEDEDGEVIKKYDIPAPDRNQGGAPDPSRAEHRIGRMGKMLGLSGKHGKPEPGEPGSSTTKESRKQEQARADEEDDSRLRFTITSGGRRMSKADFINQIRNMDPKARAQAVENSDAPENVKREARIDAREQAAASSGSGGKSSPAVPVVNEDSEAALHPVETHEDGDMKLVDSANRAVPFHDVSAELRKYQMQSGESAAERRRRQALQNQTADEDSEDDGTERVPPARREDHLSPPPPHHHRHSSAGETAAERRRREGALGLREEEESDSEEEEGPRQAPQARGIRFADEAGPRQRQSTVRWGRNVGR
ncbi:putative Na(+)/H(+) antiporter isoform 1A [Teratosphaeria destructans]|uniref:Na(+)/H(+) antiporter isoform 1A n=1 Tax=Teratosphaeria destructans TaxID=418781 RepID=A0A9W7SSW9_9PEZI|nr:putative Na(+)/H(+) antiporter isoform 1A [Teratosphaeria destructans]